MRVLLLSWNLFHGRSVPSAGRPLLQPFADTLAGWEWDVALLQEVPPWWPASLAYAAGADHAAQRTARNAWPALRRAIGSRSPDLIKANGGGCNAILVRGHAIREHRTVRLTWRPERRWAHGVRLDDLGWIVNVHATGAPKSQTHADIAKAVAHWADAKAVVLGGDLNTHHPALPGFTHAARNGVDHVFSRGWPGAGPPELLDAGALSDHRPLRVALGVV